MPTEVIMPKVDMDMAAGTIMTWHVGAGERVEQGDPLFDIETDKAAMEVEAPATGFLHHPLAEGTEVPIGTAVAWLYAEGEEVEAPPAPSGTATAPDETRSRREVEPAAETGGCMADGAEVADTDKVRATPKARSLAREYGLDITALTGTGPRGRVQAEDVRAVGDARNQAPTAEARMETTPAAPISASETAPLAVTRSKGGTGTPLVLIHGFAGDSTGWKPLEPFLNDRPLIRIDLPGHGASPRLRVDDFAGLVSEVRRAFDDLHLDRAHVIGHSLGGAVALALADTRARRITGLSLLCPAGLGPEINGPVLEGIARASRPESLAPWLRQLVADERLITEAYVRAAFAPRRDPSLRQAQGVLADRVFPDGAQAFDLRAALQRICIPTRIVWGKRDAIIHWRHALAAPGHVALHLFDSMGHLPQLEAPEEIAKLVVASG